MPGSRDVVTAPGIYDLDEDWYHSDPVPEALGGSLSVSGAKLLLADGGPRKFDWARQHGSLPTKAQRLGTVTHALTLGTPTGDLAVLDFDTRTRTKPFMAAEKEALDAGKTVILRKEWELATTMAGAVLAHPVAAGLLKGADPEVSMFWQDAEAGIWLRGRADALNLDGFGMPVIVDLKSSKDASRDAFAKSVHEYGYFRQDPHYREGWAAHLGCQWDEVDFVFIVVESDPPHDIAIYRVSDGSDGESPDDVALGREQNRIAREIYADCTAAGTWPGYPEDIQALQLRRGDRFAAERVINDWHR
jgi:hypothetical protein